MSEKVLERPELLAQLDRHRRAGRTIALTNGLFDLLHVGHLRYLEAAATEADCLVVAVNSDRSARALKGPTRPIVPGVERAELLAGFACVDYVTIFDELKVEQLLREIRPDVHCKGTDYSEESLPERDVARELGVRIAIVGDQKRHSTSDLVTRLRDDERS